MKEIIDCSGTRSGQCSHENETNDENKVVRM